MTREIKFRAWNKAKECMFIWDLSIAFSGTPEVFSEVMQYTGLKDKNGVEIYEGDIVAHYDNSNPFAGVVAISDFGYVCEISSHDKEHILEFDFEIIGNIYETPELLQGEG